MKNIYVNVIQMYDDACAFVSVMAKNLLTDLFPAGPAHHFIFPAVGSKNAFHSHQDYCQ